MLEPKKVKYRKHHRGRRKGKAQRGSKVAFGDYALKSLSCDWVDARQIEAARRAIMRYVKRGGKLWIRIFPSKPYTESAAETPMGSGKGSVEGYVCVVKPGRILFEISGVTEAQAREAFRLASSKFPLKTKFVLSKKKIVEQYEKYADKEAVADDVPTAEENIVATPA